MRVFTFISCAEISSKDFRHWEVYFSVMAKGQLNAAVTKDDDLAEARQIQVSCEVWLLEDLLQTITYIDKIVRKGANKPCSRPFEYPDSVNISSCFLKKGDEKALEAAKDLEKHLND